MILTYPVKYMGKKVAEQALDEYLINGKSLREWISILSDELTMLEKIRAEIEERKKNSGGEPNRDLAFNVCLQIIDEYKAESEG